MVYYKEETKMALVDKKAFEGIEDTVVRKFDEAKAVSEKKNKVETMRLVSDIADDLLKVGYYTEEQYAECKVGIGNVMGFHFENFKK